MQHLTDLHVGKRIRQRRWMTGTTQEQLAELIGVKFQQVQKYELAINRVSASRLWSISLALDVPVSFFFDGLKSDGLTVENKKGLGGNYLEADESRDLLELYYGIQPKHRAAFRDTARALGETLGNTID